MDIVLIPNDQRSDKQQRLLKFKCFPKSMVEAYNKLVTSIDIQKEHMESKHLSSEHIQN